MSASQHDPYEWHDTYGNEVHGEYGTLRWIPGVAAIAAVVLVIVTRNDDTVVEHMLRWLVLTIGLCMTPPTWIVAYIVAHTIYFFRVRAWTYEAVRKRSLFGIRSSRPL